MAGPDAVGQSAAAGDQTAADAAATRSDTDQTAADSDQSDADVDQHAADRDRDASARDQAAADRDHARVSPDPAGERAYETSRTERAEGTDDRDVSAAARARTATARTRAASARDESARLGDVESAARDRTSDERDRAAERSEASPADAGAPDRSTPPKDTPATLRKRAAADRTRAAADRARAAADRTRAAVDRRESRIELHGAYSDDPNGIAVRSLFARLRREADVHDVDLARLRARLDSAETELEDLRAIRDALTPPALPIRPGLELAAAFLPAAERVSGDFYLVAPGPKQTTVLVVGDVMGHGLHSARRAAFVRTAFIATAPFSDDPARLLSWVNTALIERAGPTSEFVTAACLTYSPGERLLRCAYAGHPPALWLDDGRELLSAEQGLPLGINTDLNCIEGSHQPAPGAGVLLYTDGLTEARRHGEMLGADAVSDYLASLQQPTAAEAITALSSMAAEFTSGAPTDDLCLLAARLT